MFTQRKALSSGMSSRILVGVSCLLGSVSFVVGQGSLPSPEAHAASVIGTGDSAVLSMIRELTSWKERALRSESLLAKAGLSNSQEPQRAGLSTAGGATVVGSLEDERMLILSLGRDNGAMLGALVSVGRGVVAKIVESREMVSAALVDNSYKGKLATLEGLPVQLAVR